MTPDAVTSLSADQARAWSAGEHPAPEQVADGVWAIATPIPGGTLPHTLSYVLVSPDHSIHLIDPGWDDDDAFAALDVSLRLLGHSVDDVRTVIATHFHPDHLGMCGRLRTLTGARVVFSKVERDVLAQETDAAQRDHERYVRELERWGVPNERYEELLASFDRPALVADLEPDHGVRDGDVLDLPGHTLRIVGTPGHTDGHVCLVDADRGILYSGDHVLPDIYSGIGIGTLPGSDPVGDYFDSLDKLAPYDELQVLPGHEYRFTGLGARRSAILTHHLRRTREVSELVHDLGDAPVWEYARRLTWTAGWNGLVGFWLHSALRQTALHLEFVRSGRALSWLDPA